MQINNKANVSFQWRTHKLICFKKKHKTKQKTLRVHEKSLANDTSGAELASYTWKA